MSDMLPFGWDRERQELFERASLPKGTHCGLCLRYIKVYKRKINSSMARWLIGLVRLFEVEPRWISVAEPWSTRIDSRENSKLRYWEMVEQMPKGEAGKGGRTSGFWKPTVAGIAFAHRHCSVIKYKFVYKNKVIYEEGPQVTITDALADDFDYEKLMSEGLL